MTRTFPLRALLLASTLVLPPALARGEEAAAPNPAVRVLMDQAKYWLGQHQPDRSARALERLLELDPRNADALAMLAEIQSERGDRAAAERSLAKLRELQPEDSRLAAVRQAVRAGPVNPDAVAEARRLAAGGHPAEAVTAWQRAFHGATPPEQFATEYYQALGGTPGGWDQARQGLQRLAANPADRKAQLAYAQLLTWREATRADGIARLLALAAEPATVAVAVPALRQALLWLPDTEATAAEIEAWLDRHPGDAELARKLDRARNAARTTPADAAGRDRMTAYAELEHGRLDEAARLFQAALALNAGDSEALGGLGLVRLRQGQAAEARDLLQRAIAADPAHAARWQAALEGSNAGQEWAEAKALSARGELAQAERLLQRLMAQAGANRGANPGAWLMLAGIQAREGKLADAAASYRKVLESQPANAAALTGLAGVLERLGRSVEAAELYARAGTEGGAGGVRARAEALRQKAMDAPDMASRAAILRAALDSDPDDPWIRLDLARTLLRQGQTAEARAVMAPVAAGRNPSADALQAAIWFDLHSGDADQAAALLARIPERSRPPELQRLAGRVRFEAELSQASLAGTPAVVRARLLTLAAAPDPDGSRGAAIARALIRRGDRIGAREAITTALAASARPSAAQRIAYSGALLEAGQTQDAAQVIAPVQTAGLTPEQAEDARQIRAGIAVRGADALNHEGKLADAYDQLAPVLQQAPDNPAANMALARLYQSNDQPKKSLDVTAALLARDPANMEVRRAAVDAAIAAGQRGRAAQWVEEGLRQAPSDPRAHLMAADLARAQGNNGRALRELQTAEALRRQQLGWQEAAGSPPPAASYAVFPGAAPAADPPPGPYTANAPLQARMAQATPADPPAPPPANPFRPSGSDIQPSLGAGGGFGIARDPMMQDIGRQIAAVREEVAPKFQIGTGLRTRSGTAGLDRLTEAMLPVEASFSPAGVGTLKLQATPTYLTAGSIGSNPQTLSQFGSLALYAMSPATPNPGTVDASGVGLDASYKWQFVSADIGTSPLGFRVTHPVGGIEIAPELAPGFRVRATAENRSVTDSVLSYAGERDPRTGLIWGGVQRTRGHLQLEYADGPASFYAGGGGAALSGKNVAHNSEWEFGAGGSYAVYRTRADEAQLGLDLVYFGYDKNLRNFSFGNGGYFSPQNYFAALIPVEYRQNLDNATWSIGASAGYQTFHEKSAPYFPTDAGMQAQLVAMAAGNPAIAATYPSQTVSGFVGGAHLDGEYRISSGLRLGGRLSFQHAGDWNEARALVYARYVFGADR